MRRSLTILLLCCSLSSFALVPPRDPAQRAEWYAQIEAQRKSEAQRTGAAYMPAATQVIGGRTMIPRVLVIMVNFSNYELISTPAEVDSMFNGMNWTKDGATGSVRQYFYDQSMGQYNPQFDIVGPVTLSKGYSEYGSGKTVVAEACGLVDATVDFSLYDSDNNGQVDLVYVFYAGFGRNDEDYIKEELIPDPSVLIWPQYVSNCNCGTYDGKKVTACEYSNELDGFFSTVGNLVLAGIGVPCHEYCHALGLPDLYDTKYTHNQKLLGEWDLMCDGPYNNGANTPPSLSAYERFFLGWLTPTLITEADDLVLTDIASSNQAFLISENDKHNLDGLAPDTTVFYLLENRLLNLTNKGWDIGIPGEGLLVTRINYQPSRWSSNIVNNTVGYFGVDLIEADGLTPTFNASDLDNGYAGKPGDAFPFGATEYTDITDHAITNITFENGIIRFAYRGGKPTDPTIDMTAEAHPTNTYKTIKNGKLLIHANGRTYTPLGVVQTQEPQ